MSDNRTFEKTVEIKAVDTENRTATGAVLVPNEVDKQRDFLRPSGVEAMFAEDPDDGVMHTAFPDDAAELVDNRIVDESIELNGETYPPGTWIATRQYTDDDLWQLVKDGILSGFSIGGNVSEVREYDSADVPPDISFPDPVTPGPATEIVDGQVEEVSDVDIPAVPRAVYREVGKLGKAITDRVDGEEEFVELMRTRGHDTEDARRLWGYLDEHEAAKAADTEKPIVLPNGAGRERSKVEINGTEIDLTPPSSMVNAVEAAAEAGRQGLIPSDCGTGVGDRRRDQIQNGDFGAEVVREIAAYLVSHEEDVTAEGSPPEWSEDEWSSCGNAQYAKWGGTGGGEPMRWAMRRVNEIDRARGDDLTYERVENATTADERAESRADTSKTDAMSDPDTDGESDAEKTDATAADEADTEKADLESVDDATLGQRLKSILFGETDDAVSPEGGLAEDPDDAAKAGRTLSQTNRRAVMASVDAQLDILDDAGVDHGMTRFTDRADFAFDIEEYGKRSPNGGEEMDTDKDAAAGETADDTDMSNDDTDKSDEPPAWADSLTEKVESIEKRVADIEGDDAEKSLDDAPEWAQSLAEKVDDLDERVETVSKATADTQQKGGGEQTAEKDDGLSETEKQKRDIFLPNGGR
jgi:hypothetical protein